jgi:integrase
MQRNIATLQRTGHYGTASCYECAMSLLKKYDRKFSQRLFSEIDIKYIKGFDAFLQMRGCKGNTRKNYMKSIRAVLNKAIQDKEASNKTYPFGKGGFEVAKLEEVTAKRYLPDEYLAKIKETETGKPHLEYARKLFLFSYYCYGISFIDMALLTSRNIIKLKEGDYIVYKRHKVKNHNKVQPIQIKVTERIAQLIEELRGLGFPMDNFLLPIVEKSGLSKEELYWHIRYRANKYNALLKDLAQELGVKDMPLTSYVSRHTMAMNLQSKNIHREVISQILGHNDIQTTATYLDSFGNTVIDEAAKVL